MAMLNQLFGLKNVKTSSELRSVGKRKQSMEDTSSDGDIISVDHESWNTDAKNALRVPILAKAHNQHFRSSDASLPAFGLNTDKNKYELSESNPYGVKTDFVSQKKYKKTILHTVVPSSNDLIMPTFGVYSKSVVYSQQIKSILASYDLSIRVFGPSDMDALLKIGSNVTTWVIDLSGEEDCPMLDLLLDEYSDVPCLFLSENMPTENCISKLMSFIHNNELIKIA